jgi:hypothetical protein
LYFLQKEAICLYSTKTFKSEPRTKHFLIFLTSYFFEAELAAFEKNIWGNQARKDSLDSIAKAEKNMDAKTLKKSRNRRSGSASKPAKTSTVKKRRSGGSNISSGGSARVTVRRERH